MKRFDRDSKFFYELRRAVVIAVFVGSAAAVALALSYVAALAGF